MGETMTEETEMLARMWIECDPNRGGGGIGPDDFAPLHVDGEWRQRPRWEWFVPRAEASMKFLAERGYKLVKRDA